jgi:hypothetical protein
MRALVLALLWVPAEAAAQVLTATAVDAPAPTPAEPAPAAPAPEPRPPTTPSLVLSGYVEALGTLSFQAPSNGVVNLRGFDNRHATLTLANVVLDAAWDHLDVLGRLALQVGSTPSTYYLAEPTRAGAGGASATSAELWKYVQQAFVGYRFPVLGGLSVTAGVFLSPIGPESIAVKDGWAWSRSNLFFGLPFYHTGLRGALVVDERWTVTLGLVNGWNSVVDNNDEKSVFGQLNYTLPDELALSLLYFTGAERADGAAEGRAWRHLVDAHATWTVSRAVVLQLHLDGGVEPNRVGNSGWLAGALAGRVQVAERVWLAARGDLFWELVPSGAASIFWPSEWVASGTATLDYRPAERVSFRLEYRHDHAADDVYFGGEVSGDGAATPYVANHSSQDTLTLGVTAWF